MNSFFSLTLRQDVSNLSDITQTCFSDLSNSYNNRNRYYISTQTPRVSFAFVKRLVLLNRLW